MGSSQPSHNAYQYGVEDLINLTVRQTPKFMHKGDMYKKRIEDKGWRKMWPLLDIL